MNHTKLASCLTDLALAIILLYLAYVFLLVAGAIAGGGQ